MENKKNITKADERKALEQIKKIVEGLGENSYVGTAFKGVFELAEENIEYDFLNSASDWKDWRNKLPKEIDERDDRISALTERINELKNYSDGLYKSFREQECRAIKAEEALVAAGETIKKQADEIVSLKIKLLDLTNTRSCRTFYSLNSEKILEVLRVKGGELSEWLKENFNPYVSIRITSNSAELIQSEYSVPNLQNR